ncbi:MAG: hypothetical protein MHM6MM_001481 [Cercozoa sp. M6MM]
MTANMELFKEVGTRVYKQQAQFFLNAYWAELGAQAEEVWQLAEKLYEVDDESGQEGCALDEWRAHRFLEALGETLTALAMRAKLREIDLDSDGKMSFIEYLVSRYEKTVNELMSRPQGTNEMLARAQQALDAVQAEIASIEAQKTRLEAEANGGGVKAFRAKAELAQLLAADQTGLNRALITAEAAVRKASKMGGGDAQGTLWWMQRELEEAKKYKPSKK